MRDDDDDGGPYVGERERGRKLRERLEAAGLVEGEDFTVEDDGTVDATADALDALWEYERPDGTEGTPRSARW